MEDTQTRTKFCKHCGKQIAEDAVMCVHCGRQVEVLKTEDNNYAQPNVIVNNTNTNINGGGRMKSKWVALILCFFLGFIGAHKFYEGKVGMGILYLFTAGFLGIGVFIDFIAILFKSNPYYV